MFEVVADAEVAVRAYFDTNLQGLQAIILVVFAVLNSIRVFAYIPQMLKAARDSNGASAISYTTWSLFLASHITTILYAIVCLGDFAMAAIFFGNALACLAIILIALRSRRRFYSHKLQRS